LHAAVLEATAVGPATTLLDLGCGTGLFARAATDRGARVTGIDLDPAAVARATAEVPEGVFVVGDAQEPPSGPFDVVAAVQLLMHVDDPVAVPAAAGARGSGRGGDGLGPGGGVRHSRARRGARPMAGTAATVGYADHRAHTATRCHRAVRAGRRPGGPGRVPFDYADEEELLGSVFDSALGRAVGRRAGPVALREAVLERLEPYRTAPGGYRLENVFRVLVAHRNV